MNQLNVTIKTILEKEGICHVVLDGYGDTFSALVLSSDDHDQYVEQEKVEIVFKETALSLAKGWQGYISVRNIFPSTVQSVREADILTQVVLDYKGNSLVSLISATSAKQMQIKPGDKVIGLVKSTSMSIQKES
jgi:molybdate transport system regulatory protein